VLLFQALPQDLVVISCKPGRRRTAPAVLTAALILIG